MRRQILPFGKHCSAGTFQGLNKVEHNYKPYASLKQQPLGSSNAPFQYPMRHFHTSPLINQNNHSGNSNKGWFDIKKMLGAIGVGSIITGVFTYDKLKKMDEERMKDLYSELETLSAKCTMSYIDFDDKVNTHKEFKQIEDLLNSFLNHQNLDSLGKVKILDKASSSVLDVVTGTPMDHLYQNSADSKCFIYLLHMVNCVANYHMNRNHDGEKAKELLLKGKEAVEQYLKSHYPHELNGKSFDKLSYKSQLKYLNTVDDLAKLYCSTMYFLGRSYTYSEAIKNQKEQEQAKEYFKISKYLGQQLGLFEFVLSQRSGMCRIEEQEIKDLIKQGASYKLTKQKHPYLCNTLVNKIDGVIDKFQNLKKVEEEFIANFNVHKDTQETINLKQDSYYQVECSEQLLKYYGQAIGITGEKNKIEEYLDNIHNLLVGESNLAEEFENLRQEKLKQNSEVPYRKYASVYNTIGNLAVVLSERFECEDHVSSLEIKSKLRDLHSEIVQFIKKLEEQTDSQNFKHTLGSMKTLAYDIFEAAKKFHDDKFTTTNFVLPDACHGLALCSDPKSKEYKEFKQQEDNSNSKLSREHDYTSVLDSCCFVKESGSYDCGSKSENTNLAGEEAEL
ncbi:MAG TPA: hypothetical protein QKA08_04055 [Candidatus Megaira endosymbiont of Nemacystus decipiens]|nr:hypothetical protein [Candidatus Megaera endosymbiont of Nemacystus decipiens]